MIYDFSEYALKKALTQLEVSRQDLSNQAELLRRHGLDELASEVKTQVELLESLIAKAENLER